ncbi:hypothetical protein Tco_0167871 [Tanacetum coccineum]
MENANPPPTRPVLPAALPARFNLELQELQKFSAFINSRLESIKQFLNRFADQPNVTNINDPESDDGSVETPLVSPFPHSDNDSDDKEVLNELSKYENAGTLRRERIINSLDGDDLAFECMIGFRKFTTYLDPFLPMNIISRKAYNTIMVDRLEGTRKNLVAIVRDVYVFVGSFTYITNFVVLEDIREFIMSDMDEVLMGRPFRIITKLKYDLAKRLVSFTKIFDTYTYRMPRTISRLKNFNWSKVPPLLELSQNDLMNGFRHPYEKNKFMYKNCLNLGPEYQVGESMKEWLIRGHSIERFLNHFTDQPNETSINDPEFDNESGETPLVSPFPHSDNDSDDEEVLNELSEYENAGTLRRERIIDSFDGNDLAFECMIGFRKFTAYLDPFLPMNIISCKAYNTIMVDRLEGTGKNLVAIVRDVYVFIGSFTYITDFVVLEDVGEFIMSDMAEVLMGKPFRKITKLKYDVAYGLVSFTKIFNTYTYRMSRTIPRLKNFNWSKVPPLLELSQNDLMNGFRHPYEKNKFMYKNCLNLGPEYHVNESMKEWLIHRHVIFDEKKLGSS